LPTAGDVVIEAQSVYLNDINGKLFSSDRLIPLVKKANNDLFMELINNGVSELKEGTVALSIPANTTILGNLIAGFPTDLFEPIELHERQSGGIGTDYIPMTKTTWEEDVTPNELIHYWQWRESEIKLNPATRANEVRLRYYKGLTTIVDINTLLSLPLSQGYLAARTAAIAAANIGENPSRAVICQQEAEVRLRKFIGLMIKQDQSLPVRRKRFKPFKRGR
jgi:hypothetical protein